jgi:hypothetical protein
MINEREVREWNSEFGNKGTSHDFSSPLRTNGYAECTEPVPDLDNRTLKNGNQRVTTFSLNFFLIRKSLVRFVSHHRSQNSERSPGGLNAPFKGAQYREGLYPEWREAEFRILL